MTRLSRIRFFVAACITAAAPLCTHADQTPSAAPPPPDLQKLDEGNDPGITVRPSEGQQKITEKRTNGKRTVQVQKGKNVYRVGPNDQPGSVLPGDTQATSTKPAQWVVKEFGKKKPAEERDVTPAPVAPPPPAKDAPADAK